MFRIDTATAAAALPAPGAAGTEGYFTNGNPGTGVPPTTISADWLNMIQEELHSILAAASIADSKTTYNQVLTALQSLFIGSSGLAASFGTNGYAKLPGGLILQWGQTGSVGSEGAISVSFPIAFPTACRSAQATILQSAGASEDQGAQVSGLSTTGLSVYMQQYGGGSWSWPVTAYWLAIGN